MQWFTASGHQLFATPPAEQWSGDAYLRWMYVSFSITKLLETLAKSTRPLPYGQLPKSL